MSQEAANPAPPSAPESPENAAVRLLDAGASLSEVGNALIARGVEPHHAQEILDKLEIERMRAVVSPAGPQPLIMHRQPVLRLTENGVLCRAALDPM